MSFSQLGFWDEEECIPHFDCDGTTLTTDPLQFSPDKTVDDDDWSMIIEEETNNTTHAENLFPYSLDDSLSDTYAHIPQTDLVCNLHEIGDWYSLEPTPETEPSLICAPGEQEPQNDWSPAYESPSEAVTDNPWVLTRTVRMFINKWKQLRKKRLIYLLPVNVPRPPFSYMTLACFAILNSPTKQATINQIYYFVLHHFRYYRYLDDTWKGSLRSALARHPGLLGEDVCEMSGEKPYKVYKIARSFDPETTLKQNDYIYINEKDTRGPEFYRKMLAGEIGLPRQLFYQIIGIFMPIFAGPENSALFYHLIATKQIPTPFSPLFREYWQCEHSGSEPKFVEPYLPAELRNSKRLDGLSTYGAALHFDEESETMTKQMLTAFHDNIDIYFNLQKQYRAQGVDTWETPNLNEVTSLVINGNNESDYCIPREAEDLPPGSLSRIKKKSEQSLLEANPPIESSQCGDQLFSDFSTTKGAHPHEINSKTRPPDDHININQSEWHVVGMKKRFKGTRVNRFNKVPIQGSVIKYYNIAPPSMRPKSVKLDKSADCENRETSHRDTVNPLKRRKDEWTPYKEMNDPEWIEAPVPIKRSRRSTLSSGSTASSGTSCCSSPRFEVYDSLPVTLYDSYRTEYVEKATVTSDDVLLSGGYHEPPEPVITPSSPSRISIW